MSDDTRHSSELHRSLPYVIPFVAFLIFLAAEREFKFRPEIFYPIRFTSVLAILFFFSRKVISFRVSNALGSIVMGVAVFAIWIAPDVLWPGYRSHWLFSNDILGRPETSLDPAAKTNVFFLTLRFLGASVKVPIFEELFWRGFLPRWLTNHEFWKLPMGTFSRQSFWIVAVLFASEHGSYWEVGLLAGILYNWWMLRTRSLGDCILAHAVTNACLSAYVIRFAQWQYWL